MAKGASAEKAVKEIRRKTRRRFSAEQKVRIVLEGLRGEESIATLCRREGIIANLYYRWSKEFLERPRSGSGAIRSVRRPRRKWDRCAGRTRD
jgi:transposase-like protein